VQCGKNYFIFTFYPTSTEFQKLCVEIQRLGGVFNKFIAALAINKDSMQNVSFKTSFIFWR